MRLYKRSEFVELPANTIYSRVDKSNSFICYGLFCKTSGVDWLPDFVEQDLISEPGFPLSPNNKEGSDNIEHVLNLRDSFQLFRTDLDCSGRDGMFDNEDVFVVWDNEDIRKLVGYLTQVIR